LAALPSFIEVGFVAPLCSSGNCKVYGSQSGQARDKPETKVESSGPNEDISASMPKSIVGQLMSGRSKGMILPWSAPVN